MMDARRVRSISNFPARSDWIVRTSSSNEIMSARNTCPSSNWIAKRSSDLIVSVDFVFVSNARSHSTPSSSGSRKIADLNNSLLSLKPTGTPGNRSPLFQISSLLVADFLSPVFVSSPWARPGLAISRRKYSSRTRGDASNRSAGGDL